MKRNLLPLLGIAFIVALAASGIFYGILAGHLRKLSQGDPKQQVVVAARTVERGTVLKPADLKLVGWSGRAPVGSFSTLSTVAGQTAYASILENEPVTEARISAEKATGGVAIGKGMRALSVRVLDSAGLLPFLHAGNRVDVQVVRNRNNPDASLRTILQDVEVLSIQTGEGMVPGVAIVSLLTTPENADRVALADSAANIRLLLRSPLDDEIGTRPNTLLTSLFQDAAPASSTEPSLELQVWVAGVRPDSLKGGSLNRPKAESAIQVSALSDQDATALESSDMKTLSRSRLVARNERVASLRDSVEGLSIRFQPHIVAHKVRLKVQPELTVSEGNAAYRSRWSESEVDLRDGQSFLIAGLNGAHAGSERDLLVLVKTRVLPAR